MADGGTAGEGGGAAKVRVVRCPKCQKLLPELAGFTVYRCGGCDTTLRAKPKVPVAGGTAEASYEERIIVSECPESCSAAGNGIHSMASSENDHHDREKAELRRRQRVPEGVSCGSASSATGGVGAAKEPGPQRLNAPSGRNRHRDGGFMRASKAPAGTSSGSVDEALKSNADEENRENKLMGDRMYRSQKVQSSNPAFKDEERDGLGTTLRRTPRASMEGGRLPPYSQEGPSSSHPVAAPPPYNYFDDRHPRNSLKPDGPGKVERLEQDRAVLLQKLDELRDQLSRSCDVKGKTNEREAASRRTTSSSAFDSQGTWLKNSSSSVNRAAAAQQFPLPAAHNVDSQNFYAPPPHARNEMLGYGDPFEPPLVRRGPYHPLHQYPQRTAEGYLYGQFDPESVIPYRHDAFYNQPACSYSHCYDAPWQEPPPPPPPPPPHAPPTVFPTRRAAYLANSHSLYPVDDHFMLGSVGYNHRSGNGLLPREPRAQPRTVPPRWNRHSYKPVAGGAPFIVCHNCSELLHVSPHLLSPGKALHKLRCGSCSEVISFKFDGNRLNVASPPSAMDAPSQHGEDSGDLMGQGLLRMGSRNHGAADSYSGNCEHFSGNVQSTDEKLVLSSPVPLASHETIEKDYGLNLSESENMLGLGSPSSSSEDNGNTESMVCHRDIPSSPELQSHAEANSLGSGLPLREHFGYSPSDQPVGKPGEGSRSKRFDQEKMVEINDNFNHNSIKDVSITSDVESPTDDHLNHGLSQDSGEITKEEDHPKTGKGGDSFFTGFIKKSFKDFSRFNQPSDGSKSKVSVNGHHIPDRLLKRVEKLAGPIHPGEYWYDHTAGFWGVMGQPCLGIIPPFIEEFNHPMPKNCAGGNTGVTVNGRELHQKDLDLLVGRGLPADYGRSYRIDISGKVLDDASGEELDSLGKLAPTIEKVKHGFGMRVPRTPAGST